MFLQVCLCVYSSVSAGMQALYEVRSCNGQTSPASPTTAGGVVRDYYLAAQVVEWDYAPSGMDLINNISLTESDR